MGIKLIVKFGRILVLVLNSNYTAIVNARRLLHSGFYVDRRTLFQFNNLSKSAPTTFGATESSSGNNERATKWRMKRGVGFAVP